MAVTLEHPFTMSHSTDENFVAVTDLERVVPCVKADPCRAHRGDWSRRRSS